MHSWSEAVKLRAWHFQLSAKIIRAGYLAMKGSIPAKVTFRSPTAVWKAVAFLAIGSQLQAFAALGELSPSIQNDRAQMKATLKVSESEAYTVHELTSSTTIVVREYVSRTDGRVFGVTWQGPFIPDMKQLLGTYFQQYSRAANAQRGRYVGRHPLNIHEPTLVVQTAGHMQIGRAHV